MSNNVAGKKEKQKLFRMTNEVSESFESYYADLKGDSSLTLDEAFAIMLKTCLEQKFANKYPGRNEEIQSFLNDLERIKDKYKASLAMYDSVKKDTEQRFKTELQEKEKGISDLVTENRNLKEHIQAMEIQLNSTTEENALLKEKIVKLEADLSEKDAVIKSNTENKELAKTLAEAMKLLKTNNEKNKKE